MAVLHHAYSCSVAPDKQQKLSQVIKTWPDRDREATSIYVKQCLENIKDRTDIHESFFTETGGIITSWLEPDTLSLELTSFLIIADSLQKIPSLSTSHDTNHYVLTKYLPGIGWYQSDVDMLINGASIHTMLNELGDTQPYISTSGFMDTGGWVKQIDVIRLLRKINLASTILPLQKDSDTYGLLSSGALSDATQMLSHASESQWLVVATVM